MLVTVNGQSTIDDDIDIEEFNKLIDIVAELTAQQARTEGQLASISAELKAEQVKMKGQLAAVSAELAKTKDQLATSVDRIATLEGNVGPHESKFSTM